MDAADRRESVEVDAVTVGRSRASDEREGGGPGAKKGAPYKTDMRALALTPLTGSRTDTPDRVPKSPNLDPNLGRDGAPSRSEGKRCRGDTKSSGRLWSWSRRGGLPGERQKDPCEVAVSQK